MFWWIEFLRRLWTADGRPEARRFTLGCAIVSLAAAAALLGLRLVGPG